MNKTIKELLLEANEVMNKTCDNQCDECQFDKGDICMTLEKIIQEYNNSNKLIK